MKFEIVERIVTDDMVSFKVKNDKLRNLRVKADLLPEKALKLRLPAGGLFVQIFDRSYTRKEVAG